MVTKLMPLHPYARTKEALRLRGIDVGTVRPPASGLSEEQRTHLRKILEEYKVL